MTSREPRFTGLPDCLLPQACPGTPDRFAIVREGPRNLAARPLDFRNPFPLSTQPAHGPLTDDPECFNYYRNDHAAIGLPGGPECALVDRHGTVRAYTGAWAFAVGAAAMPPDLRHRRLERGCLPVVSAACQAAPVRCRAEFYAVELPEAPATEYPVQGTCYRWVGPVQPEGRNLFLVVTYRLQADVAGEAVLHLAYAQAPALSVTAFYTHPTYAPAWENLALEPTDGGRRCRLAATADGVRYTLGVLDAAGAVPEPAAAGCRHWPTPQSLSPQRPAEHQLVLRRPLRAGETWVVTWLIPYFPLPTAAEAPLLTARPPRLRQAAIRTWERRRRFGLQLAIPEAKVAQAFTQALNHLDLCSVRLGESEFPTPGPSGGHHIFYVRDNVDLIYAYDLIGDTRRAERMIDNYWLINMDQEASSMLLWLLGKHLALTGNRQWARKLLPLATRAMTFLLHHWLGGRQDNADGLFPETSIGDNEQAIGHFVSYHLYAVAGTRHAVALARAAGAESLAVAWQDFHERLRQAVLRKLEQLLAETAGVITPTFEGFRAKPPTTVITWETPNRTITPTGAYGATGGIDWHNLGAVFPTEVLPPHHPAVTSSLARWRECYVEGGFPYPLHSNFTWLHNYNVLNLSGTWLRRGDLAETLRDLYGVLLHLSSTQASAEALDSAERLDFGCTPHNWFSAKLVRATRDLLVYEGEDRCLHLLGGLSPAWMQPGMTVGVTHAPTELGAISYQARLRADGLDLSLDFRARPAAEGVVLHLPPFLHDVTVHVGGAVVPGQNHAWHLPSATTLVTVAWPVQPLPDLSFAHVVEAYLEDYHRRLAARP